MSWFKEETNEDIEPTAVQQQIDWAYTHQNEIRARGHVSNYILNKAAALDTGFIKSNSLPLAMKLENPEQGDGTQLPLPR